MKARDIVKCLNALDILKIQIKTKLNKLKDLGMFERESFSNETVELCNSLNYTLENALKEIEKVYKEVENE